MRAGGPQRELLALVHEAGLQVGDLLAEPLRRLRRLGGLGYLALQLGDLRVLGFECPALLVRAYRFLLVRLGVLARLRFRRVALLLLLLAFRLRGILLTVHVGHPFFSGGHEKCPHLQVRAHCPGMSQMTFEC